MKAHTDIKISNKIFKGDDGWMTCKNDASLRCYGILHVPEISNPITSGGVAGIQYLQQTIKILSGKIFTVEISD